MQAAKRLVYGQVDIDSIAGPSEVLVIADAAADPRYVAADLLAQAEHGSGDESALLLTPSRAPRRPRCSGRSGSQLAALPRRAAIERVLRRRGALIVTRNLDEAVALAEEVAPEHLELLVRDPAALTRRLRNAGAIFVGAVGAGAARRLPGGPEPRAAHRRQRALLLAARRLRLRQAHQRRRAAAPPPCAASAPRSRRLAALEGYEAHAAAIRMRLKD